MYDWKCVRVQYVQVLMDGGMRVVYTNGSTVYVFFSLYCNGLAFYFFPSYCFLDA